MNATSSAAAASVRLNSKVKKVKASESNSKLRFVLREDVPQYGERIALDTPENIYNFFRTIVSSDENFEWEKESVIVYALDSRLRLIGYHVVSIGTVNESSCHPREVLRPVLIAGAYGFALSHHHPSGDPSPSRADEIVTRRLVEASALIQITFLDHVVCGRPSPGRMGYYSFREAGMIP